MPLRSRTNAITLIRIVTLAVLGCSCVVLYPVITQEHLRVFITRYNVSAPLVFITVCAVRPLLFFLPSMGLTIVAGTLFGALWGTVYVAIGGALSTVVGFFFARWFGRDLVRTLFGTSKTMKLLETWSSAYGKKAVLIMRLSNMPWDMVSYWAGFTNMSFRDFYIASMIVIIPFSYLYTYFGTQLFTPKSIGFVTSLSIIIIIGSIPYILKYRKKYTHE
ncbi:MAG TPA: hypothetical protein DCZ69_09735 [Syntrophobacteraceae bacterium]|nr:hypothetical protein [Syntrophobacteraceae bacterium]HBZ56125.1 hypothetical protein [Syntrophobacteraceae bacterium]